MTAPLAPLTKKNVASLIAITLGMVSMIAPAQAQTQQCLTEQSNCLTPLSTSCSSFGSMKTEDLIKQLDCNCESAKSFATCIEKTSCTAASKSERLSLMPAKQLCEQAACYKASYACMDTYFTKKCNWDLNGAPSSSTMQCICSNHQQYLECTKKITNCTGNQTLGGLTGESLKSQCDSLSLSTSDAKGIYSSILSIFIFIAGIYIF